jgi:hypothetical protein
LKAQEGDFTARESDFTARETHSTARDDRFTARENHSTARENRPAGQREAFYMTCNRSNEQYSSFLKTIDHDSYHSLDKIQPQ